MSRRREGQGAGLPAGPLPHVPPPPPPTHPRAVTPYANFTVRYANISAGASGKGNFCYEWKRRSCTIPRPPLEVKHHPGSLNDLLLKQLIDRAVELERGRALPLAAFLTGHLSSVPKALAGRLVAELGADFGAATASVAELSTKQARARGAPTLLPRASRRS